MVTSGSDVPVALYSVSGVLIKHGMVSAGITLLQVPGSGIYLLQVGMHTFRIVAK
jgi:hypothetical protein